MSFLGALFYLTLATMVIRKNAVFLAHKVGVDAFTASDEVIDEKYWQILTAAIVSVSRI